MKIKKFRAARTAAKAVSALALGVVVCISAVYLSGCETFSAFAEGTTINGYDVSGLSAEAALEVLREAVADYTLEITVSTDGAADEEPYAEEYEEGSDESDGEEGSSDAGSAADEESEESTEAETEDESESDDVSAGTEKASKDDSLTAVKYVISGSDISLELSQEYSLEDVLAAQTEAAQALEDGESLSEEELEITIQPDLSYDDETLYSIIEEAISGFEMGGEPVNAYIAYDEEAGEYAVVSEVYAGELSADTVTALAMEAINLLEADIDVSGLIEAPDITSENEDLLNALYEANTWISAELTYTFEVNSGTETITKEQIVSWMVYDDESATISIDGEELQLYVEELASAYSVYNSTSKFKTTSGSYITVSVSSAGETVDTDALYNDIYDNITSGISGTFEAPYDTESVSDNSGVVDFGGTYVEIDLTNQKLYLYVNGTCTLTTNIVSGSVNDGHRTPTGVYTIKSKQTNRYLTGTGYRSWVYFWMPFNGGVGLHDATWRSSFGGSIYLYSGSHGCINLPYSSAKQIYNSVSVGTYVILYGGVTSVEALTQTITLSSSFTKYENDASFNLGASTNGDGDLSYSSSDTSVVTVDSSGNVTIVGPGTATITVTADATTGYKSATATTTVTVKHDYEYSAAVWSSDKSSCKITVKCAACSDTQTIAATVTSAVTKQATSSSTGVRTYTATATYNGQTFTATTTEMIAKLEEETTTAATTTAQTTTQQ